MRWREGLTNIKHHTDAPMMTLFTDVEGRSKQRLLHLVVNAEIANEMHTIPQEKMHWTQTTGKETNKMVN